MKSRFQVLVLALAVAMLHATASCAVATLLALGAAAAAGSAPTPGECSRRMHARESLPPPPPVTPGAFDWIREIAASGPGRKFALQKRTYLIDAQYQLPEGTELRGAGRATVIWAVGAPYNTTTPGNRKGLLLGDNTWVGGFHFVGMESKRIGFASPVETPGCACRGQVPLAGCGSHHFTAPPNKTECWGTYRDIHGGGGNGVRNATVEDITVEPYTTQNLFYMPPTQAGARVSRDITVRGLRANGTWADGVNVHGAHMNVLIEDSITRCTNDDSFAVWSIGAMEDNVTFRRNSATFAGVGCFANYGGQRSTYEDNACHGIGRDGNDGAIVHLGHRSSALNQPVSTNGGMYGGAWNSSSLIRVVGNTGMSVSCNFEVPIDPRTNKSEGRAAFPGTIDGCV